MFFAASMFDFTNAKVQEEFLNTIEPSAGRFPMDIPGFDGNRPTLALVLKVLAGSNPELMALHWIYAEFSIQSDPSALESAIADLRFRRIAEESMSTMMRKLVDLWIDSGKSHSDPSVDTPSERNVASVPVGHLTSLFELIDRGPLREDPPQTRMRADGKQVIVKSWPRFDSEDLEKFGRYGASERFGQKVAMYWFTDLLDLPYSHHIARCDHCKAYFEYERAPKRTIKNGIFCKQCKGKGSAKRAQSSRDRRIEEMVNFAAGFWEQQQIGQQGSRSKWVAKMVNRRTEKIAAKAGRGSENHFPIIRSNWVTKHQQEIEAEVERRNRATRKG